MVLVAHQKLKRVLAGFERDLRFALAAAEMKMIEVVGDRLIERRQLGVDQEVMMARVLAVCAGRSEAHILQPEVHGELREAEQLRP